MHYGCIIKVYDISPNRSKLKDLVEIMLHDISTDSSSSDDEDNMDILFLDLAFPERPVRQSHVHLEELSDIECEQLFRYPVLCLLNGLYV